MNPEITYDDFLKIDIRLGTILNAEHFPIAHKPAFKIKIDFGYLGILKTSAQITTLYSISELKGKQVIAVVNFKPKQIANFMSECLILGIKNDEDVILLHTVNKVTNGTSIR
ncbi:MAG: tRNA-binding protein [Flavobacteriaceae bacterium]